MTLSAPGCAASASLLTPPGRGAIAVIAAEGTAALEAVAVHFRAANRRRLREQTINAIVFGRWIDEPTSSDGDALRGEEVVVCRTGASQVEVHCHGGVAAAERILTALARAGCRVESWTDWIGSHAACPIEAEAKIALAAAPTLRTAALLLDQQGGALRREIEAIRADLLSAPAASSEAARHRLARLLDGSDYGRRLTRPWDVAIAGRPNVGKSSLINALVGYQRAIVFDQPGTTRDVLAAETAIDGWPVRLCDSAGLRTTDDELEAAGVDLARRQLARADLVLWVLDAAELGPRDVAGVGAMAERAVQQEAGGHVASAPLVVLNKIDLVGPSPAPLPPNVAAVSALTGDGLERLLAAMSQRLVPEPPAEGQAVLFTERQVAWVRAAQRCVDAGDGTGAARALAQLLAGAPAGRSAM